MWWKKRCVGLRTIAFAPTVAASKTLAAAFVVRTPRIPTPTRAVSSWVCAVVPLLQAAGVPATHVDGTTAESVRLQAFSDFKAGDTLVLSSVGVLSEVCCRTAMQHVHTRATRQLELTHSVGSPRASTSLVWRLYYCSGRPHRRYDGQHVCCVRCSTSVTHPNGVRLSQGLYVQQVGRGLRPFPGKTRCIVLDQVGNTWCELPWLWLCMCLCACGCACGCACVLCQAHWLLNDAVAQAPWKCDGPSQLLVGRRHHRKQSHPPPTIGNPIT